MWINEEPFYELVHKHFVFLHDEYNMCMDENGTRGCVRYKSKVVWLEIWFDKYSLFIEMGTTDGNYQISLWDIVQAATGEGKRASYMASDEIKLNNGLQLLSAYVKLYCPKALIGDPEFYNEILKNKETKESEYAIDQRNKNIEELARVAWKNQDYKKVIILYQPIIDQLNPLQEKRLAISRKLVSANTT